LTARRRTCADSTQLERHASLSQEHDLAVTTVQKAMQALKDEGLVVTSPMGTFVRE
jgi:DNA-binding transcriptional MocR family regulator